MNHGAGEIISLARSFTYLWVMKLVQGIVANLPLALTPVLSLSERV